VSLRYVGSEASCCAVGWYHEAMTVIESYLIFQTGDRILEVDGIDLRQASHERAVEVIRGASNPVCFLVQSLIQWVSDFPLSVSMCVCIPVVMSVELPPVGPE